MLVIVGTTRLVDLPVCTCSVLWAARGVANVTRSNAGFARMAYFLGDCLRFGVFMCSEKPNYASTLEHTKGAAKKIVQANVVM